MDILVKHNNVNISSYVISYSREHRICTGVGTLDIVLSGTYSTAITPHDTIDIHENGDFKVRYYVSETGHSVPDGTITLQCQDKSKYLVDYFIPDSYTIDYPSYTRYWIEKFLTEAGLTYQFETTSQGNLLSNYTQLGLQSAYDQIMMLLQLSGWYMYFDGNGKAIIGSLSIDLADTAGSLGKTDILDIKVITDDKMLRNRALVWGQYDPIRGEYAFADITRQTRWNYDSRDIRTMVVSNHNIPNSSSAYNIANILLKEFAKATIEKHIIAWGALDVSLGESLRVNSHIWRGKGLITTFGVEMSRTGLTTNIILDERCPRLFGFFNFGDWVYVGTFGNGVWRKHIKFDPTWYNFSTGLTDLSITDLHINNGIFGAVGSSGNMFRASSEEGPWYPITTPTSLNSSSDNVVSSGSITEIPFSGIMARAVIVDKETNNIKFGVDTWSGLNTGDYFLSYSGTITQSGVTTSGVSTSGYRSWILEYDPYTGELITDGSGIYPVSYSGNYDFTVVDLENDGLNDYISVATSSGSIIPENEFGYNFGKHTSSPKREVWDSRSIVSYNLNTNLNLEGQSKYQTLGSFAVGYSVFENQTLGEREIVARVTDGTRKYKRVSVTKPYDPSIGRERVTFTVLNSPTVTLEPSGSFFLSIVKLSDTVYRHYYSSTTGTTATDLKWNVEYRDWDTVANTVSASSIAVTLTVTKDPTKSYSSGDIGFDFLVIEDNIYFYVHEICRAAAANPANVTNYIKIHGLKFNIPSSSSIYNGLLHQRDFTSAAGTGVLGTCWIVDGFGARGLSQVGSDIHYTLCVKEWNDSNYALATEFHNYLLYSHDGVNFSDVQIQEAFNRTEPDFLYSSVAGELNQLTGTHYIWWLRGGFGSDNDTVYVYNGSTVVITTYSDVPFHWKAANIHPIFGGLNNYYVAYDGATYYYCNAGSFALHSTMTFDARYNSMKPINTASSYAETYFWLANDSTLGQNVILKTTTSAVLSYIAPYGGYTWFDGDVTLILGNFLVNTTLLVSATPKMLYLDNTDAGIGATSYLLLQRNGLDFNLIQQSSKPIRVDISNNSPVLTVLDQENTFKSNYVSPTSNTQITPVSGLLARDVRDYRYTLLETNDSGEIVTSGVGILTQALIVTDSGVYHSDTITYSGGFQLLQTVPSGSAERIETTNYTYPGQYLFVTTSGDSPMFYQKDNDSLIFTSYSGLPSGSRATIIRCDDRI